MYQKKSGIFLKHLENVKHVPNRFPKWWVTNGKIEDIFSHSKELGTLQVTLQIRTLLFNAF